MSSVNAIHISPREERASQNTDKVSLISVEEKTFAPEAFTRAAHLEDGPTECLPRKSSTVCSEPRGALFLARDRAQSFNQRLALCAIVDHERVVFAMRRPRTTRHFLEIHEPPIGNVSWL